MPQPRGKEGLHFHAVRQTVTRLSALLDYAGQAGVHIRPLNEYLNRADIDVAEVAYLLGYEDLNSFHRAFRTREGTTPSHLRAELKRPVN
jgi:AraC-like DNA-binding protein